MRHGGVLVAGLLGALMLAAAGCSGSGDAYALRGTPTPNSGTDSGNFLISGKTCKYVTMVGFYSNAQVMTYPCKVTDDEEDALGDPHTHVTIEITTPKGPVTAKIDGTPAGMQATTVPDLGAVDGTSYPFPPAWAVAPLAPAMTLRNNDGSATAVTLSVAGGECAMRINTSDVACGLSFWSDGSYSIWVPGLLINPDYASYVIGLSFGKTGPGQWAMPRAIPGFPATYGEVKAAK